VDRMANTCLLHSRAGIHLSVAAETAGFALERINVQETNGFATTQISASDRRLEWVFNKIAV
jgi:hypothetical protein